MKWRKLTKKSKFKDKHVYLIGFYVDEAWIYNLFIYDLKEDTFKAIPPMRGNYEIINLEEVYYIPIPDEPDKKKKKKREALMKAKNILPFPSSSELQQ